MTTSRPLRMAFKAEYRPAAGGRGMCHACPSGSGYMSNWPGYPNRVDPATIRERLGERSPSVPAPTHVDAAQSIPLQAAALLCTHHRRCGNKAPDDKAQTGAICAQRGIHILL
jgi:hypothetical protein